MTKGVRNVAIIIALALIWWLVPGGAATGMTLQNLLSLTLTGALVFFAGRVYMEQRMTLMSMSDRTRAILYGSLAAVGLALAGTTKLWNSGGGAIFIWFALIGGAAYGLFFVYREVRAY